MVRIKLFEDFFNLHSRKIHADHADRLLADERGDDLDPSGGIELFRGGGGGGKKKAKQTGGKGKSHGGFPFGGVITSLAPGESPGANDDLGRRTGHGVRLLLFRAHLNLITERGVWPGAERFEKG